MADSPAPTPPSGNNLARRMGGDPRGSASRRSRLAHAEARSWRSAADVGSAGGCINVASSDDSTDFQERGASTQLGPAVWTPAPTFGQLKPPDTSLTLCFPGECCRSFKRQNSVFAKFDYFIYFSVYSVVFSTRFRYGHLKCSAKNKVFREVYLIVWASAVLRKSLSCLNETKFFANCMNTISYHFNKS